MAPRCRLFRRFRRRRCRRRRRRRRRRRPFPLAPPPSRPLPMSVAILAKAAFKSPTHPLLEKGGKWKEGL